MHVYAFAAAIPQLIGHWVTEQKGCWISLIQFLHIFHWCQAIYSLWWSSLTRDLQTEKKECTALAWLGRVPG